MSFFDGNDIFMVLQIHIRYNIFISWFYYSGTWTFGSNDFDNISFYDTGFDNVDIENEIEKKDLFQDYDDGEIVASKSNAIKMDKYIQEVCLF